MPPETRYTKSGDVNIAYQVVGAGPIDLVVVPGFVSHLDLAWEDPGYARFLHRLASFARLILFDKRGTGLSDRVPLSALPGLDQRMEDVRAVMDAAGSDRAAFFGISEGGPMAMLFAATYPARTSALVLYGSIAKGLWADDYPFGGTKAQREAMYQQTLGHLTIAERDRILDILSFAVESMRVMPDVQDGKFPTDYDASPQ